MTHPLCFQDVGTFGSFGLHLGVHRHNQFGWWTNVTDFDTGNFDAPRVGGFIDDMQQAGVDAIAL
ncbi:hypothetical protein D3C77_777410 [compost metagenome]